MTGMLRHGIGFIRRPWDFVCTHGTNPTVTVKTIGEVSLPKRLLPDADVTVNNQIDVGGRYVLRELDTSTGKIDQEEGVMLYVAGFLAVVAAALIFLPTVGVERQTTFAAGLSLLGGAATTATRAIGKGGKK